MDGARSVVFGVLAGAVVVVVASRAGGVPPFWAVALGVPACALVWLATRLAGPLEPLWTAVPDESGPATLSQAATLAARLAEAERDPHRFRTRVQPRLRALAAARLRAHGVSDVESARARDLLGPDLHRLITSPTATLPEPRVVAALLDALDRR
ncbi:hypothetical protein [Actinokineospora enzanensis]|uniref:hypothetical protein n=1 Tax=Actinokineospora enzanensis TaxID=155975 RepID=UPI0003611EEE|nr:hypothetical protein [Actinokineospora enzanensis]